MRMFPTGNILKLFTTRYCNTFTKGHTSPKRHLNDSTKKTIFGTQLFITNTAVGGILMGIGDMIQQILEHYKKTLQKETYDWTRTKNMMVVGSVMGSALHVFYKGLDIYLPEKNLKTVTKKIVIDLAICSPMVIFAFFYGLGLLEKRPLEEMNKEVKEKFLRIYTVDCIVWPPFQYINFAYLPGRYRVVYVNGIMVLYDIFLSHIKYEYTVR